MSLLMQALKKAENAKKQAGAAELPVETVARKTEDSLTLSPTNAESAAVIEPIPVASPTVSVPESAFSLTLQADEKPVAGNPAEAVADVAPAPAVRESPPQTVADQGLPAPRQSAQEVAQQPARNAILNAGSEQKAATEQKEKSQAAARDKAKSVFLSKRIGTGNRRRTFIVGITAIAIVINGVVGYYYWQINKHNEISLMVATPPRPIAAPEASPAPAPATPASATAASAPVASTATPAPATATAAAIPAAPPPATPATDSSKPREGPVEPVIASAASTRALGPKPAAPPYDSNAIQIRQTTSGNQIHPSLPGAYQAFIGGDAASARQQYQKVLQQEPNNRDALLGLAAVALKQQQAAQAGGYFTRLLELDPADPDAIAGLSSLQQGDPAQDESRLKKILNQSPQSGPVLFALGNLYAQQARWPDAQQTYFRAYTSAPANADYAFNLAVSLDRLNQPKLAQEYYQKALVLAQNSPGNFNRNGVQKRIRELEAPVED